ncbi:MAG: precorrin-3B C(17)-methyltransferase [Tissierellia bacterium]|nr:precorrin-3B C(17)-methyltransferase [Tissierellia bacterium]
MGIIYVVGIGPGGPGSFTMEAVEALRSAEVLVGYGPYLDYVEKVVDLEGKQIYTSGMRSELERCSYALEQAAKGYTTCIVSTGDAGLYGMAGPIYEMREELGLTEQVKVKVVPGVSAIFSAAAALGAPLMHDTVMISLSDLLTPWEKIEKRLSLAAEADFVIGLYNPRSKKRREQLPRALELIGEHRSPGTPVGMVKNAGRGGEQIRITTLDQVDEDFVDMCTLLIIGNSNTYLQAGAMITPRGYENK